MATIETIGENDHLSDSEFLLACAYDHFHLKRVPLGLGLLYDGLQNSLLVPAMDNT
jgi:hypothetical protein